MQTYSFTDAGPRTENQDSFCIERFDLGVLAAVADGVGGQQGGSWASSFVIEKMLDAFKNNLPLDSALLSAHSGLLDAGQEDEKLDGMATTLTCVRLNGLACVGVHCGDSRAYVLRGNGIKQLTIDHTELANLLARGKISKEDAINYPRKNILTSALGSRKNFNYQKFEFLFEPGDRLMLLTDGIYSCVNKREIQKMSRMHDDLDLFCVAVIDFVKKGGPTDNFTVVAVQFDQADMCVTE